jgi:hypothetical protein
LSIQRKDNPAEADPTVLLGVAGSPFRERPPEIQ